MEKSDSYRRALERSKSLLHGELPPVGFPHKVISGDRPTGRLHIGHLFGSLLNRVALQARGIPLYIVIADYQVLTDRSIAAIDQSVFELAVDYLAVGLDPFHCKTIIFPHSHVPQLNQLLLPFLSLVTRGELDRNPTVREEVAYAKTGHLSAAMYTYPVHQAADILFCRGTLVPVGKDQLPHLELSRTIAKRFNHRFCPVKDLFPLPEPLLSEAPLILGLDGTKKMSKSYGNALPLASSEQETAALIKAAKTDAERTITFDPEKRPEVANLLTMASLCTKTPPEVLAEEIGTRGSSALKALVTESLNAYLRPIRARRMGFAADKECVRKVLLEGALRAREEGETTLQCVRSAMRMAL